MCLFADCNVTECLTPSNFIHYRLEMKLWRILFDFHSSCSSSYWYSYWFQLIMIAKWLQSSGSQSNAPFVAFFAITFVLTVLWMRDTSLFVIQNCRGKIVECFFLLQFYTGHSGELSKVLETFAQSILFDCLQLNGSIWHREIVYRCHFDRTKRNVFDQLCEGLAWKIV